MSTAALAVMMEAPASLEEEFNDWYDTEHFPQRLALPGFLQGRRWVCQQGWPRYLAVYDLAGLGALSTGAYLAVSGERSTPWSRRVLPRTVGRQRLVLESLNGVMQAGVSQSLLLAAWPMPDAAAPVRLAIDEHLQHVPGLLSAGVFRRADSEPNGHGLLYLIATFDHPVDTRLLHPLRRPCAVGSTLFNVYLPYTR